MNMIWHKKLDEKDMCEMIVIVLLVKAPFPFEIFKLKIHLLNSTNLNIASFWG